MDIKKSLLSTLLHLREKARTRSILPAGICCAVDTFVERHELRNVFARWPESSGDVYYPVPDPERLGDGEAARLAYYQAEKTTCMWGAGAYGQARRRLLDFCIAELQRELAPEWEAAAVTGEDGAAPAQPAGMFEPVNVQRTRRGGTSFQMRVPSYTGTDANYEAIKATTPTTCCPCGQVPVCHGLRSCGRSSA